MTCSVADGAEKADEQDGDNLADDRQGAGAAGKQRRHRRSVEHCARIRERKSLYLARIFARIQRLPKTKKAIIQTTTAAGNPQ